MSRKTTPAGTLGALTAGAAGRAGLGDRSFCVATLWLLLAGGSAQASTDWLSIVVSASIPALAGSCQIGAEFPPMAGAGRPDAKAATAYTVRCTGPLPYAVAFVALDAAFPPSPALPALQLDAASSAPARACACCPPHGAHCPGCLQAKCPQVAAPKARQLTARLPGLDSKAPQSDLAREPDSAVVGRIVVRRQSLSVNGRSEPVSATVLY